MFTRLAVVFTVVVAAIAVPAAPSAASGISGYTIVTETSDANSESPKSVTVSCPDGTEVLGTGAALGYITDEVHITGIVPGRTGVAAYATEDDDGYQGNWYLEVTAVCGEGVSGREIVTESSYSTDGPDATVGVGCPGQKVLLDATARVHVAYTLARPQTLPDVVVNYVSGLEDYAVAQAFEDEDGTSVSWSLDVYAICADPIIGLEHVNATTDYQWLQDRQYITAECPTGKRLLGSGGRVFAGNSATYTGEVSFTSIDPVGYQGRYYVAVRASEDQNGFAEGDPWRLDAWAVCAPVFTAVRR